MHLRVWKKNYVLKGYHCWNLYVNFLARWSVADLVAEEGIKTLPTRKRIHTYCRLSRSGRGSCFGLSGGSCNCSDRGPFVSRSSGCSRRSGFPSWALGTACVGVFRTMIIPFLPIASGTIGGMTRIAISRTTDIFHLNVSILLC